METLLKVMSMIDRDGAHLWQKKTYKKSKVISKNKLLLSLLIKYYIHAALSDLISHLMLIS